MTISRVEGPQVDSDYTSGMPHDKNINEKVKAKLQKCQQLAYEIREGRPGYHVEIQWFLDAREEVRID